MNSVFGRLNSLEKEIQSLKESVQRDMKAQAKENEALYNRIRELELKVTGEAVDDEEDVIEEDDKEEENLPFVITATNQKTEKHQYFQGWDEDENLPDWTSDPQHAMRFVTSHIAREKIVAYELVDWGMKHGYRIKPERRFS
jgi:hypothetical protein